MTSETRHHVWAFCLTGLVFVGEVRWDNIAVTPSVRWGLSLAFWGLGFVLWISSSRAVFRVRSLSTVLVTTWAMWGVVAAVWSPVLPSALIIAGGVLSSVLFCSAFVNRFGWADFANTMAGALAAFLVAGIAREVSQGAWLSVDGRFLGIGNSPTDAGRVAALMILSAAVAKRSTGWLAAYVLFGSVVLVAADSRTAVAGTVLGLLILAYVRGSTSQRLAVIATVSVMVVGVLLVLAGTGEETAEAISRRDSNTEIGSITGRTDLWELAIAEIPNEPLIGHGSGSSRQVFSDGEVDGAFPWTANNAHNAILQSLLEHGVVGASLLIGTLVTAAAKGWSRTPSVVVFIVYLALNGLTEAMFHEPATAVLVLAGCAAAASVPVAHLRPESGEQPGPIGRYACEMSQI